MADRTSKEIKTGRFIATASVVFSILLIIHYFVSLDNATVKALPNLTNQNISDKAIDYILNNFRFTDIMYTLAYLAGFIIFWNRHTYAWWFMFAVHVSNSLFTLINLSITTQVIKAAHGVYLTLSISTVTIGSVALAIYTLVVSIKCKSTFNHQKIDLNNKNMIYYLSCIRNGGQFTRTSLIVLLTIDCIALITVVLLREGKSSGLSGVVSDGAEQLFGKQKQHGVGLFLNRLTIILSILFFVFMVRIGYLGM